MDKAELDKILEKHQMWLCGKNGGERANLSSANLSSANLRSADLRSADLSSANLRSANLRSANLSSADLRSADLSSADLSSANLSLANLRLANLSGTILDGINWLAYIGITSPDVAYAYKFVDKDSKSPIQDTGKIDYSKAKQFSVADMDTDITELCGKGINLATLTWCLNHRMDKSNRLIMFKFHTKDAICPVGSDGKFRVSKCIKVGECDWKGNLLC